MATITNNDIAKAIWEIGKNKKGADLDAFTKQVAGFMLKHRLLNKSKKIFSAIEELSNKENGIVKARITSAQNLTAEVKSKLQGFIAKKYNAKQVVLEEKIVPQVLGGFKIEVDDEVIDTTIVRKLIKLQIELSR